MLFGIIFGKDKEALRNTKYHIWWSRIIQVRLDYRCDIDAEAGHIYIIGLGGLNKIQTKLKIVLWAVYVKNELLLKPKDQIVRYEF